MEVHVTLSINLLPQGNKPSLQNLQFAL